MKIKRLGDLLEKDMRIVQKRKIFFIVPLVIVVFAAIMMIIYNFTVGSPLNLGTDFTGGYSIDIKLGNKLTEDNYDEYCKQIGEVIASVTDENGTPYNIVIENYQMQGSGDTSAVHVKYRVVKGMSEDDMLDVVNPAVQRKLESEILMIIPDVDIASDKITLTYSDALSEPTFDEMKKAFLDDVLPALRTEFGSDSITFEGEPANAVSLSEDNSKQIVIACAAPAGNADFKEALVSGMKIHDEYSGKVSQGDLVGATVSTELLFNAVLAVSLALVFMLCYIGLRFQLSSGLACIIALFHDVLVMTAFMAICRIPINNTFIAALITILGYSINNSIIIFDRVRENSRSVYAKNMSPEDIANKSIRETLLRSINTTITTLIMILMVAIIGVTDIRVFAFPIIIGLIAGTFSSICIAPSLWAMFQHVGKKNRQRYNIETVDRASKRQKAAASDEA